MGDTYLIIFSCIVIFAIIIILIYREIHEKINNDKMTLFLRTKTGQTIVDIELWVESKEIEYEYDAFTSYVDVTPTINIENYSELLIGTNYVNRVELINDFTQLSELRGWLWEKYFSYNRNTEDEYENVKEEIKNQLQKIADKYNLQVIID